MTELTDTKFQFIVSEKSDWRCVIALNRPDHNVLNIAMMREINDALTAALADESLGALVIRANGKFFSAGVDVAEHTADQVGEMISEFHEMFRLLERLPCPTVALVQGSALGGGCELACFCDIVLAADRAKFGQPEIAVGVFPPIAAAAFPHWVSQKKLYELLLTGRAFSAEEARQCGLVNHVYPYDDFEECAAEFLASLGKHSPLIGQYTKRALRSGAAKPFPEALAEIEKLYLGPLMATQDASEGLKAFMNKRAPEWKNK